MFAGGPQTYVFDYAFLTICSVYVRLQQRQRARLLLLFRFVLVADVVPSISILGIRVGTNAIQFFGLRSIMFSRFLRKLGVHIRIKFLFRGVLVCLAW